MARECQQYKYKGGRPCQRQQQTTYIKSLKDASMDANYSRNLPQMGRERTPFVVCPWFVSSLDATLVASRGAALRHRNRCRWNSGLGLCGEGPAGSTRLQRVERDGRLAGGIFAVLQIFIIWGLFIFCKVLVSR